MGKDYWEFIEGEHEEAPMIPEENPTPAQVKAFKEWNQGARQVSHWLSISIKDTMIGHVQDAVSPKEAWDNLMKFFASNTRARKIQLKTDLNTVEQKNQSINEYTLKIKNICENLASINAPVDDDDKIEVCLRGLGPQYKAFATSIRTRENLPSFSDLVSMLIMEEKSMGENSSQSNRNLE